MFENPEKHEEIIWEMKIEAGLISGNSPYAEVRAVVDNKDDPNLPTSTVRAWTLGILLSALISLINQLFEIRYPPVYVDNNVAQLVAYPMGVAWAKWMPNATFRIAGKEIQLNPGPFNKKEHMIITIMASIAKSVPYTQYVPPFLVRWLPRRPLTCSGTLSSLRPCPSCSTSSTPVTSATRF